MSDQDSKQESKQGWHAQDTPGGFREQKGSGAGAGDAIAGAVVENVEEEDRARQGPIVDEHLREGWGGEGEPYATAQGPNARDEGEAHQDKEFWKGRPPAGAD
jgi:hypothetical protein